MAAGTSPSISRDIGSERPSADQGDERGPGNDRLNGRPRSDLLFAGRGNDLIRGATTVFPGSGTNRVDVADGRRDDRAATSDVAPLSRAG